MIPQNVKDILGNVFHAGLLQSLVLILFIVVFAICVIWVMSRPKKYYQEEESAPLYDNENEYSSHQ